MRRGMKRKSASNAQWSEKKVVGHTVSGCGDVRRQELLHCKKRACDSLCLNPQKQTGREIDGHLRYGAYLLLLWLT